MGKDLEKMSLAELWQLFPIILGEHNPAYRQWYEQQVQELKQIFGASVLRINHIGSTAVPNLVSKPCVDILLELAHDWDMQQIITETRAAGWLLISVESTPLKVVLNQGYTEQGFAEKVFHLHVRRLGDWDELYFRDYLLTHPEVARDYAALKQTLAEKFTHNRDGYTKAKTEFIAGMTTLARAEFGPRYAVNEETHPDL